MKVAYFSMEIALDVAIPTFSGGLGVLAGDTLRSAADLGVPVCGVSLVHRKGYFTQSLDDHGWQIESNPGWNPGEFARELSQRVVIDIEDREVTLRCWEYIVAGAGGYRLPVFLLDADLPCNHDGDRRLTDWLYGGDDRYRLCQEAILGIGGIRMLRALGFEKLERYHMNEGHSALLTLELLMELAREAGRSRILKDDIAAVRKQCVFTTHTPVPAGHDRFPLELVTAVLGQEDSVFSTADLYCSIERGNEQNQPCLTYEELFDHEQKLNMTYLALNLSHYVNGVAARHAEVSQVMFGGKYAVDSITNGVHAANWICPEFQILFEHYIPGWKVDNSSFRKATMISLQEIQETHRKAKESFFQFVLEREGIRLDPNVLTLGFARRSTAYKRALLMLSDMERLRGIAREAGGLQIIFSGKAHPRDHQGKEIIQKIWNECRSSSEHLRLVFVSNYDINVAKQLIPGVDVWVNTPEPPLEASGTSGMKAALNGVPSLSVMDGWWIEGCVEGVTGWALNDAESLYHKLENVIVPLFRDHPDGFAEVMRSAISLNGSFFNTQRMMQQYVTRAYCLS